MRRTLIFVLALSALLGLARHEAPPPTVWIVFAIFISIATVWIRGQYADSLDGRQWVIPYWIGVPAFILATGLAVLIFVSDRGAFDKGLLTISGLVLVYLVMGSGLTHLRQSPSVPLPGRRVRTGYCGACLTAAGLAFVVGGAALLGPAKQELAGALLIGGGMLVLMPVGLALWSEGLLRWLCERNTANSRLWVLGGAGLAVFAGATAAAAAFSSSTWLILVLGVLGLLMVALVSTTQADVVAVTAVVALMGVTPPQAPEERPPGPDAKKVLVALGDSFMSGEGAQVYHHGTDDGGDNECRRSPTAWAALAAQNPANFDGLMFLACSGARTENILSTPGGAFYSQTRQGVIGMPKPSAQPGEEHTQLDAYGLRGRFRTELAVLSIGGNDAGFSTIGLMCLAPGNCNRMGHLWTQSIDQVREQLRATYGQVSRAFHGVPVVVVPYPDPIMIIEGRQCGQVALSADEQRFIQTYLIGHLNKTIREVAQEYGFYYLAKMQDALADQRLQLCDDRNGERPGINFIGLRSVRGVAEQRFNPANWLHSSLHPNERGHAAMLRVFESWLAENKATIERKPRAVPSGAATPGPTPPRNGGGDVAERLGPCGLFDTTGEGCRPQGQRWAYQQIGHTLLGKALWLWIAVACAGAWCAAVAFFAYRRRMWARRLSCPRSGEPD